MIKHTIRTKDGGTEVVEMTRAKAIRLNCLECCGWEAPERLRCTARLCPLWPYRMGHSPEICEPTDKTER